MKELISKQLVRYLEGRGVTHIFGLCGHTNIALLTEIGKSSIHFVNSRHEQVAAHCADGYACAKRETGVVLSHLGPDGWSVYLEIFGGGYKVVEYVLFPGQHSLFVPFLAILPASSERWHRQQTSILQMVDKAFVKEWG